MTKHTKGPWTIGRANLSGFISIRSEERGICEVLPQSRAETQANAALIAAAPELLEACKATEPALWVMIATTPDSNIKDNLVEIHRLIRDAIEKAEA